MKRPLLLSGFMATGKSTVGKIIAERLNCQFFDLDAEIVQAAGQSIAEIFSQQGESEFRRLEKEHLFRLLADQEACVISLGGGALLERRTRIDALFRAVVVTLEASEEVLLRRVESDQKAQRPLLQSDDPAARISKILAERRLAYRESHAQILTDEKEPSQVAEEVIEVWGRDEIAVAAGDVSYCVSVGAGKIRSELARMIPSVSGLLMVTDQNVGPLYASPVGQRLASSSRLPRVILTPGERP